MKARQEAPRRRSRGFYRAPAPVPEVGKGEGRVCASGNRPPGGPPSLLSPPLRVSASTQETEARADRSEVSNAPESLIRAPVWGGTLFLVTFARNDQRFSWEPPFYRRRPLPWGSRAPGAALGGSAGGALPLLTPGALSSDRRDPR